MANAASDTPSPLSKAQQGRLGAAIQALATDPRGALQEAHSLIDELGENVTPSTPLGKLHHTRAVAHYYLGQLADALRAALVSLSTFSACKDDVGRSEAYNILAVIHRYLDDYPTALGYYDQCLQLARELNTLNAEANTLGNIGALLFATGDTAGAITNIERCVALFQRERIPHTERIWLSNLAEAHLKQNDVEQAETCLQRAAELNEDSPDITLAADIARLRGDLAERGGDAKAAGGFYAEARKLAEQLGDRRLVAVLVLSQSRLSRSVGETDAAQRQTLEDAIVETIDHGFRSLEAQLRVELSLWLSQQGDAEEAYRQLTDGRKIERTLNDEEAKQKLQRRRVVLEVSNTTRELESSRTEVKRLTAELSRVQAKAAFLQDAADEAEKRIAGLTAESQASLELASASSHAARGKSEFLANLTHEFLTPLNAILGMAQILELDANRNESDREAIETIRSSGQILLNLTRNVLALARIEAGNFETDAVALDPRRILADIAEEASSSLRDQGLDFSLELDASLPEVMQGDMERIQTILRELLSNAVRFTNAGRVRLAARQVDDTNLETLEFGPSRAAEAQLEVVVEDTGPGIHPEKRQSIFTAFTQGDSSTTRRHSGLGLGLTLAERIASALGGSLRLDEDYKEGSRFILRLPLGTSNTAAVAQEPRLELDNSAPFAVIVESDESISQRLVDKLSEAGVSAQAVVRGQDATWWVQQPGCTVVFIALTLVDTDGFALSRLLQRHLGGNCPPLVATAAQGDEHWGSRLRDAGFATYLSNSDLTATLPTVLEQLGQQVG